MSAAFLSDNAAPVHPQVWEAMRAADAATWAAVIWQSVGNSLFGYAAWGWLLSRHPAATITPMANVMASPMNSASPTSATSATIK